MPTPATLFDVNLWVALTFSSHPHHAIAHKTYQATATNSPAYFCRTTQQSFLRLVTSKTLLHAYGSPQISNQKALNLLTAFMSQPEVFYLPEPEALEPVWHRLAVLDAKQASPKAWMDAYLAAFAMCANVSLTTLDHDFTKYTRHGLALNLLTP